MTATNLSDVMSGMEVESTENTTEDAGEDDEIPEIYDEIGADEDRVRQFRENQPDNFDELTELANALAESDDLWELHEEYRLTVDLHRINLNHLRGKREGDFVDAWREALYGDTDDPEAGTKNALQTQMQDHDLANLPRYKVMFPEPVDGFFPGDAVKWSEGMDDFEPLALPTEDGQDSHIWVTMEFAQEFAPYGEEIEGQVRPLPPAEPPAQSGTPALNPSSYSVDTLKDKLEAIEDPDELEAIRDYEVNHDDRKTARQAIDRRIRAVEGGGSDDSDGVDADELVAALEEKGIDVNALLD